MALFRHKLNTVVLMIDVEKVLTQLSLLIVTLLTSSAIFALNGCDSYQTRQGSPVSQKNISVQSNSVITPSVDPIFGVSHLTKSCYRVVVEEELHDGARILVNSRIVVPKGLTHSQLDQQVRLASKTLATQHHPTSMILLAYYEGSNTHSGWTAAICEFRPVSDEAWKSGGNIPFEQYRQNITLADQDDRTNDHVGSRAKPNFVDSSGLTESERQRIFIQVAKVEDRATEESEAKYPVKNFSVDSMSTEKFRRMNDNHSRIEDELQTKYRKALGIKLHMKEVDLRSIGLEGRIRQWSKSKQ